MNEIQIFKNPQFGEIRTAVGVNNEPLFCAIDVCKALGYSNGRDAISKHVQEDDVAKCDTIDSIGRKQNTSFINESGLYSLIFGSKMEDAKKFKQWVTSEVLPAIRKTGGYILANVDDTAEELMSRAVLVAQETLKRRDERIRHLEASNVEQQKLLTEQSKQIEANAPKVLFADAVVGSKTSCLIGELAKIISQNGYTIGQNRLFKWLREHGYLGRRGEQRNIPNQHYIEKGLFELKKNVHSENGVLRTTVTTKVTQRGCMYFVNKFLKPEISQQTVIDICQLDADTEPAKEK